MIGWIKPIQFIVGIGGGGEPAPPVAAPVNLTLPVITGNLVEGSTLTVTPGTWSGSPSLSHQWILDGTPVSGATGLQWSAQEGVVSVIETATNSAGSASAQSSSVTVDSSFVPISATGGTVTDIDVAGRAYRVHTFLSSADFVVSSLGTSDGSVEYVGVGGGGSGGHRDNSGQPSGGGGGGRVRSGSTTLSVGIYPIVVGAGGAAVTGNNNGINGSPTSGLGSAVIGGGFGAQSGANGGDGGNGGGGGYSGSSNTSGGSGDFSGGSGLGTVVLENRAAGGGGGASQSGGNAVAGIGGAGGNGQGVSLDGTVRYFGAGAGGGAYATGTAGQPGLGGVGGVISNTAANNGASGLGAGGSGSDGTGPGLVSGAGGSGRFVIRYPIEGL